ncbi:MAG: BlaI/MecI/CopY family transcriptional regulator [Planctomycetota bacterium]
MTILWLLWEHGAGTTRDIRDDLAGAGHSRAVNTVGRLLAAMEAKGLLVARDDRRPRRYLPAMSQAEMQQRLVTDLVNAAFRGLPAALVKALLATPLSTDDLLDIRKAVRDRFEAVD